MAKATKAAEKSAAPKQVFFIQKDEEGKQVAKFEILGKRFCYQGETLNAEEASKNEELMAKLIANKAPAIKEV